MCQTNAAPIRPGYTGIPIFCAKYCPNCPILRCSTIQFHFKKYLRRGNRDKNRKAFIDLIISPFLQSHLYIFISRWKIYTSMKMNMRTFSLCFRGLVLLDFTLNARTIILFCHENFDWANGQRLSYSASVVVSY